MDFWLDGVNLNLKLKKEMEKKGEGKDRENKIKGRQEEEMILDNQFSGLVLLLARQPHRYADAIMKAIRITVGEFLFQIEDTCKALGEPAEGLVMKSLIDIKNEIHDLEQLLRCKVCLDSDACMVFFPCRHMAICEYCGSFLDKCPVCRALIEEAVKVNKKQ